MNAAASAGRKVDGGMTNALHIMIQRGARRGAGASLSEYVCATMPVLGSIRFYKRSCSRNVCKILPNKMSMLCLMKEKYTPYKSF